MKNRSTSFLNASLSVVTAIAIAGGVAACTDRLPTSPDASAKKKGGDFDKSSVVAVLFCHGDRQNLTVTCDDPKPASGGTSDKPSIILGNQNTFVKLSSTNVFYDAGTGNFTFNVTVRNLIPQTLGETVGAHSYDGTGVQVFFASGPTVTAGTGLASVVGDGVGTFTAPGQPYFSYPVTLAQYAVTSPKTWTLNMPATVTTFDFTLLVSASVFAPNGYIDLDVQTLKPPTDRQMTYTVRNANGTIDSNPGTMTWSINDPSIATVDANGLINPLRAGVATVTCQAGSKIGTYDILVDGVVRTWTGAVNTDWNTDGNWLPDGIKPVAQDSVLIPLAAPVDPVLSSNVQVNGVTVEDAATISLGAFDLTAGKNVFAGLNGGITNTSGRLFMTGTATTVQGKVPTLRVLGSTSLTGNVNARAPLQVDAGRVTVSTFRMQGDAN
jgi:hypothetical protein